MTMNLTYLRAFDAVAEAGSFVGAAAALHVTQPTLSEQVKALERKYGVALFDRRGRGVVLTPLGHELRAISRRLFDLESEAHQCLADAGQLRSGLLRLGTDGPVHIMPLLAAFRERYPGVDVALSTGNGESIRAALLANEIDLAVIANVEADPRLVTAPLREGRVVAIVAHDHPLAEQDSVSPAELAAERLVTREYGSVTQRIFHEAWCETEHILDDIFQVDSREALHAAVAAGLGIGVVDEVELPGDPRVVRLPIDGLDLRVIESVVCWADRFDIRVVRAGWELALEIAARDH
ncbi:LysR substrate-binding domain-containing protein [Phytoactinopolyspora mesophila]|uniref:LysR family transcriptional regulator n=1 Tax=Phytoactinopolyspora mesophila TaxID=2650750 RepID=A0A7K3LY08_9ACTN|nr:LysR substrate-binding domain-containing protein [Phytoactinopolyspora mesophila]NDL55916.1 LysR family transcriptional regulator [Phytoactinopolyspora mesophila]